ncbi:protein kinase domain-containing protein [Microbacterium deminutum]|uniref:protein kinase domain-containing protein n=1 Tax=Microbacterium deminutum TaxID=344164 RepID=UPI0031D2FD80
MQGYDGAAVAGGRAQVDGVSIDIDGIVLERLVGTGANGFVFAGRDIRLDRPVAVKIWPPRKDRAPHDGDARSEQALAEAAKVARIKHEHIASVYSADFLPSGWPYVVMEFVDDPPLREVIDELSLLDRLSTCRDVYRALDTAEREGIYHGDLHGGNVLVRWFHATVIDFGTSLLAGHEHSLRRHARLVHSFVHQLLPELENYLPRLDIPGIVRPEYVTYVEDVRIGAAEALMQLDGELDQLSGPDTAQRLKYVADQYSTALIDLTTPITAWLDARGVEDRPIAEFRARSESETAKRRSRPWPTTVGMKLRPVPPFVDA